MAITSRKLNLRFRCFAILLTVLTLTNGSLSWAQDSCSKVFAANVSDTSVDGYKAFIKNLPGQDVVNSKDVSKLFRGIGGSRSTPSQLSGFLFGDEKFIFQSSSLRIATQNGLQKGLAYRDALETARKEVMTSIQEQLKSKSVEDFDMDQSRRSYYTLSSNQRTADVLFADGLSVSGAIGYGIMSFARSTKENPGTVGMVEVLVISPNEVAFLGGVLPGEYLIMPEIFPKAVEGVYFGKPKTAQEPYKFDWYFAKISHRNEAGAATEVQVYAVNYGPKMETTDLLETLSNTQDLSNFISNR